MPALPRSGRTLAWLYFSVSLQSLSSFSLLVHSQVYRGTFNFCLRMNNPFLTLLGSADKAGGALGAITAMVAYYVGLAELLASDGIDLPLGKLSK